MSFQLVVIRVGKRGLKFMRILLKKYQEGGITRTPKRKATIWEKKREDCTPKGGKREPQLFGG